MRRLSVPLRVIWDWDWPPLVRTAGGAPRPDPDLVRAVAARIREARVLLLEIGYPDAAALREDLAAALAGFAGSAALVLTPATLASLGGERPWEGLGVDEVWVDRTPLPGGAAAPETGGGFPEAGLHPPGGVRLYLTSRNVRAAAAIVAEAADRGIARISLPGLPLFGEVLRAARQTAPAAAQVREFAGLLAPVLRAHPALDLRVHHYGLAQVLGETGVGGGTEEAPGSPGCQAGSALAYIDPSGVLYPCASLPVPVARLASEDLAGAWGREALVALRERLGRLPPPCRGCAAEESCRGGCRGWAQYLSGSWEVPGPDCTRG